jgi:hypothetical protein
MSPFEVREPSLSGRIRSVMLPEAHLVNQLKTKDEFLMHGVVLQSRNVRPW